MYVARLLEDDRAGAGIHRLHVEVSELRDLRQLFTFGLILPNVGDAVAIGDEED